MDEGRKVWAPHAVDGYKMGYIRDITTDTVTVEPLDMPGKTVTAPYQQVFPCEEYDEKDVDDNCKLILHRHL